VGASTGVPVKFSVSLPADYYTSCRTYPVLYSLHGKEESNQSFLEPATSIRQAVEAGVLSDVVIITPDSYIDGRWENGSKGPAEDNFIKELIPHVEKSYRVKPGAKNRLLTGFSMGGHGAFRFAVKYPTMFAGTYSVDGAMASPDDYLEFLDGVQAAHPRIYTVGGQLCGERVQAVVDAYRSQGVDIPYTYFDLEHDYTVFVAQDAEQGWPAMKFLQASLGA
jgi:enterochelin esterase-like enzyme